VKFKDRIHAGKELAEEIQVLEPSNSLVLALPRGGVPLGKVLAEKYDLPFNVLLSKKIGHPSHAAFAIGAIAEGGDPLFNQGMTAESSHVQKVEEEIKRRRQLYNQVSEPASLEDKNLIIVDDGVATGMTLFAAIEAAKKENPKSITVAVPVIPKETYQELAEMVDSISAVEVPENFEGAVGAYYQEFPQLKDEEVQDILRHSEK